MLDSLHTSEMNDESVKERIRAPCYRVAVGVSALIVALDAPSLTELLRCCNEHSDVFDKHGHPGLQATKDEFDRVYKTELLPIGTPGEKGWEVAPVAIPFVVVGTLLGRPFALAWENERRRRIWNLYHRKWFVSPKLALYLQS